MVLMSLILDLVMSPKLILMKDDSMSAMPISSQTQHSAVGSERAVTLT